MLVLHVGAREQAAHLTVTFTVLADQQHATGFVALELVLHPGIDPNDGLDPLVACALVELHHAEQVDQIGNAQGGHAVSVRAGNRLIDLDDAVGDRILGMQSKMDEARRQG